MCKTQADYNKARLEHIKEWTEIGKSKDWAEADFLSKYPDLATWNSKIFSLNGSGEQRVINKINEIIEFLNREETAVTKDSLESALESTLV